MDQAFRTVGRLLCAKLEESKLKIPDQAVGAEKSDREEGGFYRRGEGRPGDDRNRGRSDVHPIAPLTAGDLSPGPCCDHDMARETGFTGRTPTLRISRYSSSLTKVSLLSGADFSTFFKQRLYRRLETSR